MSEIFKQIYRTEAYDSANADAADIKYKKQGNSDRLEHRQIIEELKVKTNGKSEKKYDNLKVDWNQSNIPLIGGSSLHEAHEPGVVMMARMIVKPAFISICEQLGLTEKCSRVESSGQILSLRKRRWENITEWVKRDPDLDNDLRVIADIAATTGGLVDQIGFTGITHWLGFHEYNVPETIAQTKNLIRFMEMAPPSSPALGTYWEILTAAQNMPLSLTASQRQHIRTLYSDYLQDSKKLLDHLQQKLFGNQPFKPSRSEIDDVLEMLLSGYESHSLSRAIIDELGWYGSEPGQTASDEYLQQVMVTAILLDLHPEIGEETSGKHVAGYDIYSPENVEKSLSTVHSELERHLIDNLKVSSATAPLASHLLLAGIAPEFLVKDLPESLLLGSIDWVTLRRAVALAELNAPGSSRLMTYSQILEFVEIDPVNKQLELLHSLTTLDPILDWALINGIVSADAVNQPDTNTSAKAVLAYEQYIAVYAHTAHVLSTPLPTRKDVALEVLKTFVPECDFLEKEIIFHKNVHSDSKFNLLLPGALLDNLLFSDSSYLAMSLVELYMSHDLVSDTWDRANATSIYKTFPKLSTLHPVKEVFSDNFDTLYNDFKNAFVENIKLFLSSVPYEDRVSFQCGDVSFYTIRHSVAVENNSSANSVGLSHIGTQRPVLMENQRDKDAATGRYGVVMCSYYQGKVSCYEVFTLQRQYRKNNDLARLIVESGTYHAPSRLAFTGNPQAYSKPVTPLNLPIDVECYTLGVAPREGISSTAVIEKLGVLPTAAPSDKSQRSAYQSYHHNKQLGAIARFIETHRPLATYEELKHQAWGQTKLELEREQINKGRQIAFNILVPFKACIEDILSDDTERQSEGALACTLEAATLIFVVIAAAGKIASIATKSISAASKAASMARVGLTLGVSVLNPLDGVPQLLYGGAKLLKRGALRLGKYGLEAMDTATFQLRRLTGSAQSYDLIKAANRTDTVRGTIRTLGDSGSDVVVWATRENNQFYALNTTYRDLRGGILKEFRISDDLLHVPLLGKVVPKSYAKTIIASGIPIGNRKVDFAIEALNKSVIDSDSKFLLKAFFGSDSNDVTEWFLNGLNSIKEDYKKLSTRNIAIESLGDKNVMGGLYTNRYKAWQAATTADGVHEKFIQFDPASLNNYYRHSKYDNSRIGDLMNHELSHGRQGTQDFIYADISHIDKGNPGSTEISQLLNLGKGPDFVDFSGTNRFRGADLNKLRNPPIGEDAGTIWSFLDEAPGMLNADSQSTVISLLSQAKTNPPAFRKNLRALREALNQANGKRITGPVRLGLGQGA
ncbi:hypothetical protein [Pseudomonas brassicacearum]|uniref:hypothetical protein n=1 Tax=Pseudomonas brassicacearum TaxID=930166 RepID=UPI0011CD95A5|nr:hypothetical protein [Pseudomonas brassicacearum]